MCFTKDAYLALLMVNHHIVGLDITVHDALAVTEIQGLQELENVEADIVVGEARVQGAEVRVIDGFKDQARGLALVVPNNVKQCDNIGATGKILENLDLSLDLLLLDWLQDLDDAFLVVDYVDTLKDLRVLSSTLKKKGCQFAFGYIV